MQAFMNALSPGYFETMQIPILEGRDFTDRATRRRTRRSPSSTGGSRSTSSRAEAPSASTSAGVPARRPSWTSRSSVSSPTRCTRVRAKACVGRCSCRTGGRTARSFYVRTHNASASAYSLMRNEVKQLDSAMPVYGLKTLESQLDETLLTDRLIALLSAGFGVLATLLASIGLYGVMAFAVARRRKELGIRLALGAQPGFVIWLVMREVLLLLAIGLAVGLPAALALGRYVSSQLYGIEGHDPRRGDHHDRVAGRGVGRRRVDSRASRQPHRSDPRAASRVDRCDNLVCSALERTRTSLRTACVGEFRLRTRHSP